MFGDENKLRGRGNIADGAIVVFQSSKHRRLQVTQCCRCRVMKNNLNLCREFSLYLYESIAV
jgi:hypothetical protein